MGETEDNFGHDFVISFSCVSVKSRKKIPWHLSYRQEMVMTSAGVFGKDYVNVIDLYQDNDCHFSVIQQLRLLQ